jgi:hypothetical protein
MVTIITKGAADGAGTFAAAKVEGVKWRLQQWCGPCHRYCRLMLAAAKVEGADVDYCERDSHGRDVFFLR